MSSSSLMREFDAPQTPHRSPSTESSLWAWLPVVACSIVFAVEPTSYFGADHTSGPLRWAYEAMFGPVLNSQWGAIHNAIRKSGHFLGYGLFSLVCFRAFWMTSKEVIAGLTRKLRAHGLAIFLTFLVASADEIHQTFLPNRVGQFRDVMIDTSGAAVLGCLLLIAMLALDLHRQARAKMCGQPQGASAQVDVLKGTGFSPYINSAKSAGL